MLYKYNWSRGVWTLFVWNTAFIWIIKFFCKWTVLKLEISIIVIMVGWFRDQLGILEKAWDWCLMVAFSYIVEYYRFNCREPDLCSCLVALCVPRALESVCSLISVALLGSKAALQTLHSVLQGIRLQQGCEKQGIHGLSKLHLRLRDNRSGFWGAALSQWSERQLLVPNAFWGLQIRACR